MINVTMPFLPSQEKYFELLKGVWKRNWLTNNGPLVNELELKLKEYLDVPHFLFLNNGTIALQIAIKALGLQGEIITTPFSYVATTSSIVWEGCEPVFADIDPDSLNIDPKKIENCITPRTSAILATHVYGNPCDIDAIQKIANKHKLKVIYDAAHCFGTKYKGKSVFAYGDIVTTSFHSTKLFHTVEGGGVFTNDPALLEKMAFLRNFGHNGPVEFAEVGINGKNSEFHAAMGLANLEHIEEILKQRKDLSQHYDERLQGLRVKKPVISKNASYNYAYYPVVFETEEQLLKSLEQLNGHNVFARRYFYPSLNTISYTSGKCQSPVSEEVSSRILCLPLYHQLSKEEVDFISRILLRAQKY
jgi:dTDP-4-amino-4,6-dideoxygalactose transaminase